MLARAKRIYLPLLLVVIVVLGGALIYAQRPLKPFVPPDANTRAKAVGDISNLDPSLKATFSAKSAAFKAIPKPGAGDWLANHHEPGQTFYEFLKTRHNRPNKARTTLYILPLGKFKAGDEEKLLKPLRDYSERYFNLPTKLLRVEKDAKALGIKTRINPGTGKRQLLSTDILKAMPKKLPADAFCMLAVTTEDLYPEESWNFVFGQASLRQRVGVFSFARYDPTFFGQPAPDDLEKVILRRSCDVLAHETGHMFGIRHCIHFHCLMNGSNNLEESDAGSMHLCPVCLRKLHNSTKFDPAKRYSKLAGFYKLHGFKAEQAWSEKRARVSE